METYLYRLTFRGPVHFGMEGIGLEAVEEHLCSDSLTSALVNAAALLEGPDGPRRMIQALGADPPAFLLSSLFPYGPSPADETKTVEAVVKPLTDLAVEGNNPASAKDLKKIRFLLAEDFLHWIRGKPLDERGLKALIRRSQDLKSRWWKENTRPRVALDRVSQGSSIWNQAALFFAGEEKDDKGRLKRAGAGLYGLVRFQDAGWKKLLENAFRLLGDTGLGGERTYGLGLFHFGGFEPLPPIWQEINTAPAEKYVLLSLFYPRPEEKPLVAKNFDAWELRERRGYIVSGKEALPLKRKRVRMIVEGSVSRRPLRGTLADVTPVEPEKARLGHGVFRSGLAFYVPLGGGR